MTSAIMTVVLAVALWTGPTAATATTAERYACVLAGQGACSDVCLGNRISPADRKVRLTVDFGRRAASLNGIPGRLDLASGKLPIVRWHLATIGNQQVVLDRRSGARAQITLTPLGDEGLTAWFACSRRPD